MDELLGRKVPYSAQAEQAVIGSMLIDPNCVPDVMEHLRADEFYIKLHQSIFETVASMFAYGQTIDPVTVLDQMRVRGLYQDSLPGYAAELMRNTPTAANVLEYAAIVRDRALLRRLGEAADEIRGLVDDESGEAETKLEAAERIVYALRQGRSVGGLMPISQVVQNVFDEMNAAASSGNKIPGLATGFPDLDRKILGLNKSELILVAARPGMGKTSIALNMALQAGMTLGKTVAIFSLEMSREQLTQRLLSRAALVPLKHLLTGQLSEQEWRAVSDAAQSLSATNILIDDNPMLTVADMNAQCRRVKDLDLVVIDYLQLMQSAGSGHSWSNESRTQAVSDISRMMKIMAKELNVPVVTASQLSRANEARQDKRPMLSDLRESGAIEQDADVVIGLYRDFYYNKETETQNAAEAIILKNRKGETGTVPLVWLAEYTSFGSAAQREEDDDR